MLNISKQQVDTQGLQTRYRSFKTLSEIQFGRILTYWLYAIFGTFFFLLFMPWTQNIRTTGKLTTLYPNERPQHIVSTIDGRIEKWFVREGDFVEAGDTIIHMSEIKDQYFDPALLERTNKQLEAKTASIEAYNNKVEQLTNQITALEKMQVLKTQQARNKVKQSELKVTADSIAFEAAKVNYDIAVAQFNRQQKLYDQGLKSLTDLEKRKNNLQKEQAKFISTESKLLSSKNGLLNARIDLANVTNEYADKIAKAKSDLASAQSMLYDGEAGQAKLQNTLANYQQRVDFRYIVAPTEGFITQAKVEGVGETVKAGQQIVSIVNNNIHKAVELYVDPVDLPLIRLKQEVRVQFDGWPALVFSGWPGLSFGTFAGEVVAIDNMISSNNKYRILVAPGEDDEEWPELVRYGSGAYGFALLKDVPVWYELWRQLNGFPPDFYIDIQAAEEEAHIKHKDGKKDKK
jgi:multidrug resistance efflux pump